MSILTKPEILKAIKKKQIIVEPLDKANIGPGSIDLRLGNKFRLFKKTEKIHSAASTDYKDISELVTKKSIVIFPGETILGITHEKITLAPNLCGWLEGRSRFARLGLLIHISASFMQPGLSNRQVLEISNMGKTPYRLEAGMKICQFIFQRTIGKARYQGTFKEQAAP